MLRGDIAGNMTENSQQSGGNGAGLSTGESEKTVVT